MMHLSTSFFSLLHDSVYLDPRTQIRTYGDGYLEILSKITVKCLVID